MFTLFKTSLILRIKQGDYLKLKNTNDNDIVMVTINIEVLIIIMMIRKEEINNHDDYYKDEVEHD